MKTKIITLLLCVCMLMTAFSATAVASTYTQGNVEIEISDGTLTDGQIETILDVLLNGENEGNQTRGFMCTLFGHHYEGSVESTKTIHKVYSTAPRCVIEIHRISTCTRCGYVEDVVIQTNDIYCCD